MLLNTSSLVSGGGVGKGPRATGNDYAIATREQSSTLSIAASSSVHNPVPSAPN